MKKMRQKIAILLFALCATATVNAQTGPMKASQMGNATSVDELVGWFYWYNKTTSGNPTGVEDEIATLYDSGTNNNRYVCFTKVDESTVMIYGMFEMPVIGNVIFSGGKAYAIDIAKDQIVGYNKTYGQMMLSNAQVWDPEKNEGAGGWAYYSSVRFRLNANSWYNENNWIRTYIYYGEGTAYYGNKYIPGYARSYSRIATAYADWNAVMYTTYDKNIHNWQYETKAVNVTQVGNTLQVQNFLGNSQTVNVDLHADNTLSIENQLVRTPDYMVYPATGNVADMENPIYGTGTEEEVTWGNFCYSNGTTTYYFNDSKIVFLNKDVNKFHFPVALTMTDAGWASFSSEKALDFTGTGLTPYAVSEVDATNGATLSPVEVAVAPHTGLFVSGVADNYEIPTVAEGNSLPANALVATSQGEHTSDGQTYWGLGLDANSGEIGLKKMSAGSVAANKAYLIFDRAAAGAKSFLPFNFGGTTAIEGSLTPNPSPEGKGSLYNLQGQRVGEGYRGIVIKNGKKVVKH